MKRIYLFAYLVCATVIAQAQSMYSPAALGKQLLRNDAPVGAPHQQSGNRDVFYDNTFGDCSDWALFNAFDEGYAAYVTGINFQCGEDLAPSGGAPIDPIASTTAADGFMMVDSDGFANQIGIENCWFQNVDPINCSGYDHVSVQFETFYRMWDSGNSDGNEFCLVEVSNDGVTWPDPSTYLVSEAAPGTRFELWPGMGTQDPVSNPTIKVFEISTVAANQPTVYLRFRWKGTYGYA